jgi:hypothetical protein
VNRRAALLSATLSVLLLAGCGAAAQHHPAAKAAKAAKATHLPTAPPTTVPNKAPPQIPHPGPTGIPAATADVAVIRGWADALRHGNVGLAARYFALPSEMINGTDSGNALVLNIHSVSEAVAAQTTLPCGARLISTDRRGRYVNALFALTGRPGPGGSSCGGSVGTTARTNFVIADGRILKWIRAPSEPGDQGTSPAPSGPPGSNDNA